MKPVFQEDVTENGDCLRCCVASLLEVTADEVPDFCKWSGDWLGKAQEWLARRGLCLIYVALHENTPWFSMPGEPWAIFIGLTENKITHAVVGRCEGDSFAIVHDPHPNQKGVESADAVLFIAPLDPATLGARLKIEPPRILKSSIMPTGLKHKHRFRDNGR